MFWKRETLNPDIQSQIVKVAPEVLLLLRYKESKVPHTA